MFRNLIVLFIINVTATTTHAEEKKFAPITFGWFETFIAMDKTDGNLALDVGVVRQLTLEWGLQTFLVFQDGLKSSLPWGEGLIGPTYRPIPEIEFWFGVGAQIGIEHVAPRFAGSVWVGVPTVHFYGWVEWDTTGPDGVWYDLQLRYQPLEWIRIAAHARRGTGWGPRVDISISKTPLTIWGMYAPWGPEEGVNFRRGVAGLIVGF